MQPYRVNSIYFGYFSLIIWKICTACGKRYIKNIVTAFVRNSFCTDRYLANLGRVTLKLRLESRVDLKVKVFIIVGF
jgi:hypothetical protein